MLIWLKKVVPFQISSITAPIRMASVNAWRRILNGGAGFAASTPGGLAVSLTPPG